MTNEPSARTPLLGRLDREVELLDRHVAILQTIARRQPIDIGTLASETPHSRHEVLQSIRALSATSLVAPSRQGAITTEWASRFVGTHGDRLDAVVDRLDGLKQEGRQSARRAASARE